MTFLELIRVHGPWADSNFPTALPWMPIVGISEELGEYARALDRSSRSECLDGLGDMAVFLADFVRRFGVVDEVAIDAELPTIMGSPLERLTVAVGDLSHAWLKHEQSIRGTPAERRTKVIRAAQHLLGTIKSVCTTVHGIELETVLDIVWGEVSARDWNANTITGAT